MAYMRQQMPHAQLAAAYPLNNFGAHHLATRADLYLVENPTADDGVAIGIDLGRQHSSDCIWSLACDLIEVRGIIIEKTQNTERSALP
jgi:hypothetical protein